MQTHTENAPYICLWWQLHEVCNISLIMIDEKVNYTVLFYFGGHEGGDDCCCCWWMDWIKTYLQGNYIVQDIKVAPLYAVKSLII